MMLKLTVGYRQEAGEGKNEKPDECWRLVLELEVAARVDHCMDPSLSSSKVYFTID